MKKFFTIISLSLCLMMGGFAVNSCSLLGGDDEELEIKIKESGDTMTLTIDWENCKEVYTATFANDKCTKLIRTQTWDDAEDAQYEYDNLSNSEKATAKVEGKVVTYDLTASFAGKSKAEVRKYFEGIKAELED